MRLVFVVVALLLFIPPAHAEEKRWVRPVDEWHCPKTHPIKGNINRRRKTRIYHMPGGAWYKRTKPEKCFRTEEDARADGFRRSKR